MKDPTGLRTFEDAVAIVTGAGRGIGLALCQELAQRKAKVVLADRDVDLVQQAATAISNSGGRATAVELNVSDPEAFASVVRQILNEEGRLDYLFNNAGVCVFGDIRAHTNEDWQRVFDVNLGGVVNGIQAAYPIMLEQGFGHLVNTSSMAGLVEVPWLTSYSASKFAVVGLSNSLRVEAAEAGVRVTVLCPGVVKTKVLEDGGKFGRFAESVPIADRGNLWTGTAPMEADEFARQAIRDVAKNKPIVVKPAFSRFIWNLNCFFPPLGRYLTRQMYNARKANVTTTEPNPAEN